MEPGKELDMLVAEKVMGHKIFHNHGLSLIASGQKAFDRMIIIDHFFWEGTNEENEYCWQLPAYSTDIAVAWSVVEKLATVGWRLLLEAKLLYQKEIRAYTVTFERLVEDDLEQVFVWEVKAVPLAICLAALEALNVEVENEAG